MHAPKYNDEAQALTDPEIQTLSETLRDDGLVLMPTDTTWSVVCSAVQPVALQRLHNLQTAYAPEILVCDLDMLRQFVPDLHPRLETLLAYHRRPLSIRFGRHRRVHPSLMDEQGHVRFRISSDPICRQLIRENRHPLASVFASLKAGNAPTEFGSVSSTFVERTDYVSGIDRAYSPEGISVLIQFDPDDEELIFLRE